MTLSSNNLNTIQQVNASQQQIAFHQRALRLAPQSGLQRINMVWLLDVLVGRKHWQHLLPNELTVILPGGVDNTTNDSRKAEDYTRAEEIIDFDM